MEIKEEPSFFEKLKNLFSKKSAETTKLSYTPEEAYNRACFALKEALIEKKELTKLIYKGVKNDYANICNQAGNLVTFSEDELGRGVMVEYDSNDKPVRMTTFAFTDGSIYRIEEKIPNTKSYNKTIFFHFDNSHIEIQKGIRGNKAKELFSYEKEIPSYYKKDCVLSCPGAIPKEEYYF